MSPDEQPLDRRHPDDVRVALATIVGQLSNLQQGQSDMKEQFRDVRADVKELRSVVDGVPDLVDAKLQKFVTNDRFEPVQKLVFGLVGMVLLTIGGALLATILKSHGVAP
jgi:hypothetical protein